MFEVKITQDVCENGIEFQNMLKGTVNDGFDKLMCFIDTVLALFPDAKVEIRKINEGV